MCIYLYNVIDVKVALGNTYLFGIFATRWNLHFQLAEEIKRECKYNYVFVDNTTLIEALPLQL
jgi:hypothetical protein